MLYPTTLTQKGQVTIPMPLRELLGLATGSKIQFSVHRSEPKKLILSPVVDFLSLQGVIKTKKRYSKGQARKAYLRDVLSNKV